MAARKDGTAHAPGLYKPAAVPTCRGGEWTGCGAAALAFFAVMAARFRRKVRSRIDGLMLHAREIAVLAAQVRAWRYSQRGGCAAFVRARNVAFKVTSAL
jgi:hypothetical protein